MYIRGHATDTNARDLRSLGFWSSLYKRLLVLWKLCFVTLLDIVSFDLLRNLGIHEDPPMDPVHGQSFISPQVFSTLSTLFPLCNGCHPWCPPPLFLTLVDSGPMPAYLCCSYLFSVRVIFFFLLAALFFFIC